jgi:hypothetical protein
MICKRCGKEASGLYPKWVISGWNGKEYEPYYYWAHSSQYTGADGKRHTKLTWHYMGKWEKYYYYYKQENRNYQRWKQENKEQYEKYSNYSSNLSTEEAFKLLGITTSTTPENAKKAFRQAVFKFHPDREPDINKQAEATTKMQQINAAWEKIGEYYKSRGL